MPEVYVLASMVCLPLAILLGILAILGIARSV